MEHYSAIKKEENLPRFATWMKLEGIILSEISEIGKNQILYDLIKWEKRSKS